MNTLERMSDFFASRVKDYDGHMLGEVEGCREGYIKMAELVPSSCVRLLDLGCGTGLELEEIFKRLPELKVTGIDLCEEMLNELRRKLSHKDITLINGDYFNVPLGENVFDCAVSFQTMHHFTKSRKAELYKKIYTCLKKDGVYIECDYMVETQAEEDRWFRENEKLRKSHGIPDGELYHYDTPCTIENQIKLFLAAGFKDVKKVFRIENTTIIIAKKE